MQPAAALRTIALVGADTPSYAPQAHGETTAPAFMARQTLARQDRNRTLLHGLADAMAGGGDQPAAPNLTHLPPAFARPVLRRQVNMMTPHGGQTPGVETGEIADPDLNTMPALH